VLLLAGLRFLPTFCYGMAMVFVPLQLSSLAGGYLFETWSGLPMLAGAFASACALCLLPAFFRQAKAPR
jgi:hypothetical protein